MVRFPTEQKHIEFETADARSKIDYRNRPEVELNAGLFGFTIPRMMIFRRSIPMADLNVRTLDLECGMKHTAGCAHSSALRCDHAGRKVQNQEQNN